MESPIAAASLALGSLPARHARYRPCRTAVILPAHSPAPRCTGPAVTRAPEREPIAL